jgi:hypothetical protein
MPWEECSVMDERLRFVSRLLEGETMTDVCCEFGISRKTGYKIYQRYQAHDLEALSDRSRRPVRYANQLPPKIEGLIVRLKREKPHWGARNIIKTRGAFPSDEAAMKLPYLALRNLGVHWNPPSNGERAMCNFW